MKPSYRSLILFALPAPAQAAADVAPDLTGGLVQMLTGLTVVIVLLVASLWLIKRLSAPRGAAAGMKVLGAVAVGTRERVVLVEIGPKVLVIGVTQSSISALHTLDSAELPEVAATAAGSGRPEFSGWLRQSLERRKHDRA